jgi:hypothetical protein
MIQTRRGCVAQTIEIVRRQIQVLQIIRGVVG